MRDGFRDVVSGWTLYSGVAALTEYIEAAAEWTRANGPLEPDEQATVRLMIEARIARGGFSGDEDGVDGPVSTHCNVCGVVLRGRDEHEMGMCEKCASE